jgi:hypothetical protein
MTAAAHAGPSTSANYNVPTDTTDAGGRRATSASYTHDGSAGGVVGISTVAAPAGTAKHGYIAQLTEVTALQLAASPLTINETGTRQLSAAQVLDDATTIALAPNTITWSVQSGSITGISSSGLATAATVYQDTAATAQGSFAGLSGTLSLTVLDTIADNFGSYAADGISDDWQFQYFGLNNPNAAPGFVSDGSGHNNLFKFTAGLVPNDATSRFNFTIQPVPGNPGQLNLVFSPIVSGRTYTVKTRPDLATGSWQVLGGTTQTQNGNVRTVTDTAATEPRKFFQVEITRP